MISLSSLTMHYGHKILFENVSIKFDPGKRYGIVGANGSGKSTLLRLLSGNELAISGDITIPKEARLGILNQDHFQFEQHLVLDVVLQGKPQLWAALQEKDDLLQKEINADIGHRLGELEEVIAHQDGYNAESFASELLAGLGIETVYHTGPMSALSGGFKLRALLAQVLFQEPDVLILDEPTNHLDIISIAWLEHFLINTFKGTLLLVSHDREFLNSVCTNIADIDYGTIQIYPGNYDTFMESKALFMEQKLKKISSQERKLEEMQAFVDRFRAKATKARQAQSRLKQMERIEVDEVKRSSRIAPRIPFKAQRPSGKEVLEIKNLSKSFGNKKVLNRVNTTIFRGDKVAIIGPNGIGKSTLMKLIMGDLKADQGEYKWGYETYRSYFAQDHKEAFKDNKSVYDWLYETAPEETIGTIRGLLGQLLFSGDDVKKHVSSLSGGECARLLFAKMVLEHGNILLLDEPTNHLDVESIEELEQALIDFEGTVLFVSHDRRFVSKIATRVIALTPEGIETVEGSYSEYLELHGDDYLDRSNINLRKRNSSNNKTTPPSKNLSYEDKKELRRLISKLTKTNTKLEKKIETYEEQIAKIDDQFADASFYQAASNEEIKKLTQQKEQLASDMAKDMELWENNLVELEESQALFDNIP